MAARFARLPQIPPSAGPRPDRRRLTRPLVAARPAASVRRGAGFAARFAEGVRDDLLAGWRAQAPRSAGVAWSVACLMAGEYHRDGAERGWTPGRFASVLAGALAAVADGHHARTREKYAALLFSAGVFVPVRCGGGRRGTLARVFLDAGLLADAGDRVRRRGEAIRASDAARKRRLRARDPQNRADGRRIEPPIARTALDQIDLELAKISDSRHPALVSHADGQNVRPTTMPHAAAVIPTTISSQKPPIQQIPHTPTPSARGLQGPQKSESLDAGGQAPQPRPAPETAPSGGRMAFAAPELLEDHLYRFVASRPVSEAGRLKEQVGEEVYAALANKTHYGIQGLKSRPADEVRRACRQVALAHTPKPTTQRQRAARFRCKIDRRAGAASSHDLAVAAEAILGPAAAAGLNPQHLALQGLSLPLAEAIFGRGQRALKVGSKGPTAMRKPAALGTYFLIAFRAENRQRGMFRGRTA